MYLLAEKLSFLVELDGAPCHAESRQGLAEHRLSLQGCPEVQAGRNIVPQTKVDVGQSVVSHRLEGEMRGGGEERKEEWKRTSQLLLKYVHNTWI